MQKMIWLLKKYEADRAEDLAEKKGELGGLNNPLGNALTDARVIFGDASTIDGANK